MPKIYKVVDTSKTYVNAKGETKPSVNFCLIGFDGKYISIRLDKYNYALLSHFFVVEVDKITFLAECNKVENAFKESLNNAYKL